LDELKAESQADSGAVGRIVVWKEAHLISRSDATCSNAACFLLLDVGREVALMVRRAPLFVSGARLVGQGAGKPANTQAGPSRAKEF
jgi:hypothetical protein